MATLAQMKRAAANLKAWREQDKIDGLILCYIAHADGSHTVLNSHTPALGGQAKAEAQRAEWLARQPELDIRIEPMSVERVHAMVASSVGRR